MAIPRSIAVAAVVAAGAALAACGSSGHPPKAAGSTTSTTAAPGGESAGGTGGVQALQHSFVSVVRKVRPSVVQIATSTDLGSGIVYDTKGDIVTNDHVVGSARSFQVTLASGQKASASLVGAYPAGDLAVIRVRGAHTLTPATFGDSKRLQVGDIVMAIGNPLGLSSSVTEGIVSYNGRTVAESDSVVLPSTIQTSAAINPGNSGGALVDLNGDVVGVPTLAAVNQQAGGGAAPGIGFAIPSNTVKLIAPQLISTGRVTNSGRAALGITASDAVGPTGVPVGVLVVKVTPGEGAAAAGIKAGDVITEVNGQPVQSLADLQDILAGLTPGGTAKVKITNQAGASRTVSVKLTTLPG